MLFRVDHHRTTGVRVIPRLPVQRLTRLEGYNAIGKSAMIRLIQVCVGQHPYPADPTLWDSFRAGIGQARVELHGITGAGSVTWDLDATGWRAEGPAVTNLGEVRIDGRVAGIGDVQELLAVHTILGNEDLTKTLVRRLGTHRATLNTATGDGSPLRRRLDAMDKVLRGLATILDRAVSLDVIMAAGLEANTSEALQRARIDEHAARERVETLSRTMALVSQLADVKNHGGNLDVRIDRLAADTADLERQLSDIAKELATFSANSVASNAAGAELSNARKHAERVERRRHETLQEVGRLGGEADLNPITAEAVSQEQRRVQKALDAVQRELGSLHSSPEVADVTADIEARLGTAEDAGLGGQILIQDPAMNTEYTITQLRLVMTEQGRRLRSLPAPDAAVTLQAAIKRYRTRLTLLSQLARAVDNQADGERKAEQAQRRLQAAVKAMTSTEDPGNLADVMGRRERLTKKLSDAAEERASLVRARAALGGGDSPENLSRQVLAELDVLELDAAQLPAAHADAVAVQQDAEGRLGAANEGHRVAAMRLRQARDDLAAVVQLVTGDPQFAWVRAGAPTLVPVLDAAPEVQENLLGGLAATVESLRERIAQLRQTMTEVRHALRCAQDELAGASADDSSLVRSTRSWFSEEVSTWFNQPQLIETVFEHGQDVRVNLNDKTIYWEANNTTMSRPLEAFSSGERGFAYTRAQLEVLDAAPAPANRLLVLDEFGAFIAREWQHRLEQYLMDHARRHPSDSTLLVLPLTRTEEELRQGEHLPEMLAQLGMYQYFTHDLFSWTVA